jgi:uncharacterized protein YggT (Ycf19 family)
MLLQIINFIALFTDYLIRFLMLFIFLRVILSWFTVPNGRISGFLREMTDPIILFVRRWIPFSRVGLFDLSPVFAYILLDVMAMLSSFGFSKLYEVIENSSAL